ncbi:MAG: MFS transporter [Clostridia bacterium]|nr:MFS transporter [Clostridia bacterium]
MKLNIKRTALVGLAFMAIQSFWGLYDFTVPLILKDTYGLQDTASGVVMAMDNVVALVLLPLFGSLSDRCNSPMGRRMPFLLGGAAAAAVLMLMVPMVIRSAALPVFLGLLALLLIIMGTFRSPTVALMPDVTPRHLRSSGNAIINLMGAVGSALTLVLINFLVIRTTGADGQTVSDYTWLFVTVAVEMVVCALTVKLTIPERKLAAEAEAIDARMHVQEDSPVEQSRRLTGPEMRSLVLLLCSVSLWFMGYNAITTAFSKYAMVTWHVTEATAANCVLVATVAAIASYWPVGLMSSRFGRKRMILTGLTVMVLCFLVGTLEREMNLLAYVMFVGVGMGWASIGVNSYPMVVELASGSDVGKYTGYYYTFSMAAQVLTPILSGALLEHVGYWTLFPYALVMMSCALVTMSLVRHGDSKPRAKRGLEALDVED